MILEFFGSDAQGWDAHGESDSAEHHIMNCPFCGSDDVKCRNTHTVAYQVVCEPCGASGPTIVGSKTQNFATKRRCQNAHEKAFDAAINQWNFRLG